VLLRLLAVGVVGEGERVVQVGDQRGQAVRLLEDAGLVAALNASTSFA
jgi:hypothetical protein